MVMIDRPLQYEERISYVSVDNVGAAATAIQHFVSVGQRRIAHITGHMEIADARDRLQGYKNGLEAAGLPIDPNLIYYGAFHRSAGYNGLKHLWQYRPDAVFAASDTVAVGVLQAAHELGVRVPDDVGVIGFDDIDVATQSIPLLTTVSQPVQQKGTVAANLLIDLIEGRVHGPQHILLPTELIVRQSSATDSMSS